MKNYKAKEALEQVQPDTAKQESDTNHKLPDNPDNPQESISTADDISNGKTSKTNVRKEDKDFDTMRSGH